MSHKLSHKWVIGWTVCASLAFASAWAIGQTTRPANSPDDQTTSRDAETHPTTGKDLRDIIGIKTGELSRVEVPRLPAMSLRGFVKPRNGSALALLEIAESSAPNSARTFLVKVGTEIPVTVSGSVAPIGRGELSGLNGAPNTPAQPPRPESSSEQSQIILHVIKVTAEGVIVEAGLLDRTITIR